MQGQIKKALTILAKLSADPWWTAAAPSDGVAARAIFTFRREGAVLTKKSLGACWEIENQTVPSLLITMTYVCVPVCLTLVADEANPPIGAVAASFPLITFSPIRTVITG